MSTPTRNIGSYLWKRYPRRQSILGELKHPSLYPNLPEEDYHTIEKALGDILICIPHVEEFNLRKIAHPLLVIGSDGIWDVLSAEVALQFGS